MTKEADHLKKLRASPVIVFSATALALLVGVLLVALTIVRFGPTPPVQAGGMPCSRRASLWTAELRGSALLVLLPTARAPAAVR